MKLIIQIPCFNEEKFLGKTLSQLPKKIKDITKIETLIINDGSNDNTVSVAKKYGAKHIVSHSKRKGLSEAFSTGISECLSRGADIIVNTDADNQYKSKFIKELVKPIINNNAEMVIGVRDTDSIKHFSIIKKILQKFGSFIVRKLSGTEVSDTTSGFRAISREAAFKLNKFDNYTYTLDTLIQAGHKNITVKTISIEVNQDLRPSKLIKSNFRYVLNNAIGIIRIFLVYRPLKTFFYLGSIIFFSGVIIGLRYVYFLFNEFGEGNIQSLILSAVLLITGFITLILAFIADLIASNRRLLEEITYKLNKERYKK